MEGDILVVGGGPSFAAVDFTRVTLQAVVIGVNDAALKVPGVDWAVSMDRLWTESRYKDLERRRLPAYLRRSAVQNLPPALYPGVQVFDCDNERARFTDSPLQLDGPHSGFCALHLAFHMEPKRVFLYGFDMRRGFKGVPYWYPPYPWRKTGGTSDGLYKQWAGQFAPAAAAFAALGVEVYNVCPVSAIPDFLKITAREAEVMVCE